MLLLRLLMVRALAIVPVAMVHAAIQIGTIASAAVAVPHLLLTASTLLLLLLVRLYAHVDGWALPGQQIARCRRARSTSRSGTGTGTSTSANQI